MTEHPTAEWIVGDIVGFVDASIDGPPPCRSPDPAFWAIADVAPDRAALAADTLGAMGFETWRAVAKVRRQVGRRRVWKTVPKPLLPSVLFVNAAPKDVWELQSLVLEDGVTAVRGFARGLGHAVNGLARVSTRDLLRFRYEVEGGDCDDLSPFAIGEMTGILRGAFAGMSGEVASLDLVEGRISLSVSVFGREVPVSLDLDHVGKASR